MDNTLLASAVTLKAKNKEGELLRATFIPSMGMNMVSYKKGDLEVIDQTTLPLFEERYAGLGAMIGPHFHHRQEQAIAPIKDESLFPHIARVKAQGSKEPFSHGIGRYAPWRVEGNDESSLRAVLSGTDVWNGYCLKDLEGQDFKMSYDVRLLPEGLEIKLGCKSDTESVVGLHTYYSLGGPHGTGTISCRVQDHYVDKSQQLPIPSTWNYSADHTLIYPVDRETDFGFHPFPDPLQGTIQLACASHGVHHRVQVHYECDNQENSFQIWHKKGGSFVCIEPLSAKDPRKPKLSVSRLQITIAIL